LQVTSAAIEKHTMQPGSLLKIRAVNGDSPDDLLLSDKKNSSYSIAANNKTTLFT
jgi:hypothetical protein